MNKYKNHSRLLIDEEPLIILPSLAKAIGLNQAIFLQQVHYWLKFNAKTNKNYKDGHYWTYNTLEAWQEQLPFFSVKTIQRVISDLKKKGLIITDQLNANKYNRTIWYRLDYKSLSIIEEEVITKRENACGQNDHITFGQNDHIEKVNLTKCITETITENKKEILNPPSHSENLTNFKLLKDIAIGALNDQQERK